MNKKNIKVFLPIIGITMLIFIYSFFHISLQKNKEKEIIEAQKNKELEVLHEKEKLQNERERLQEQKKFEDEFSKLQQESKLDKCLQVADFTYNEQWKSKCKDIYNIQSKSYKECRFSLSEMEQKRDRLVDEQKKNGFQESQTENSIEAEKAGMRLYSLHLSIATKSIECDRLSPSPLLKDGGCSLNKSIAESINGYYKDLKDECYKRYK